MARRLLRRLRSQVTRLIQDPTPRIVLRGKLLPYWRLRFYAFGSNAIVYKPSWVLGAHKISGGAGTGIIFSPLDTASVRIGRGTWIGERVAVLPGADIGVHCVIGTNRVVRGKIPDYSVAVGAPARVVGSTRDD